MPVALFCFEARLVSGGSDLWTIHARYDDAIMACILINICFTLTQVTAAILG